MDGAHKMANFSIGNDSTSVNVALQFNLTSTNNTWSTSSGDNTILGTSGGNWIWSSTANTVNLNASSGVGACQFTGINMTLSLTDPFQNVASGATGTADVGSTAMQWTRTDGGSTSASSSPPSSSAPSSSPPSSSAPSSSPPSSSSPS
jgi:hypothetical protein